MKQFLKFMFASCLGSALLLILAFIIMVWTISSSTSKNTVNVKPKSVLYMNLDYEIPDRSNEDDLSMALMNFNGKNSDMSGMNDIIANIDAAKDDPNISGIFLELSSIGTSAANIQEIRSHIIKFRESGKFVISYAETMAQNAYYLATAGDKI